MQGIRPANFGIFHFINLKRYRSNSPYNKITEKCFLLLSVILFAFATPDKLFCSILRYQSVALQRALFSMSGKGGGFRSSPADRGIEHDGEHHRDRPADRPRNPDAGRHVIQEHGGQAVNVQIELGVREHRLGRVDCLKQLVAEQNADAHQRRAGHATCDQRGQNAGLHLAVLPRAEKLRRQDGRADVAAEGKGDENERDLIAVANGGKGVVADELAGNKSLLC